MGCHVVTDVFYGAIIPTDSWSTEELEQYETEICNTGIQLGLFGNWEYDGNLDTFVCIPHTLQSGYQGKINPSSNPEWHTRIESWLKTKNIINLEIGWHWASSFR